MKNIFNKIAKRTSDMIGHPISFAIAFSSILVWLVLGPVYHYSDNWQLVMNSVTGIVTYLIVFLMQNTQNRDTESFKIKLDELIRANKHAKNALMDLDKLSDEQLKELEKKYKELSTSNESRPT